MADVFWTPITSTNAEDMQNAGSMILYEQPVSFVQEMVSAHGAATFSKCPAVLDYYKNTFVIKAPMDLTVQMSRDRETNASVIQVLEFNQAQFDSLCTFRYDGSVTLPPSYLFFSDTSVLMESLPLTVFASESTKNMLWISGAFDISKWVRPVDCTFLLRDETSPVVIKRGDPLWVVRFTSADGSKIVLKRVPYTRRLREAVSACVGVKYFVKQLPLQRLYRLADGFLRSLGFKKQRCPFSLFNKNK